MRIQRRAMVVVVGLVRSSVLHETERETRGIPGNNRRRGKRAGHRRWAPDVNAFEETFNGSLALADQRL